MRSKTIRLELKSRRSECDDFLSDMLDSDESSSVAAEYCLLDAPQDCCLIDSIMREKKKGCIYRYNHPYIHPTSIIY